MAVRMEAATAQMAFWAEAKGSPKLIADLHQHNSIGIRTVVSGAMFDWELIEENADIALKSNTVCNTNPSGASL